MLNKLKLYWMGILIMLIKWDNMSIQELNLSSYLEVHFENSSSWQAHQLLHRSFFPKIFSPMDERISC